MAEPKINFPAVLARYGLAESDVVHVLGVTRQALMLWSAGKRDVGPKTVLAFEQRLNVPRHELRPDLWPPPPGYRKPKPVPAKPKVPRKQRVPKPAAEPVKKAARKKAPKAAPKRPRTRRNPTGV